MLRTAIIPRAPIVSRGSVVLPPPAPAAPVISGIVVVVTAATQLTIQWDVDQFAQGWIEYGYDTGYGSETEPEISFLHQRHLQTMAGLLPETTVHYRIHAVNQGSQVTISPDQTAATAAAPAPTDYPPAVSPLTYVALVPGVEPGLLVPYSDQGGYVELMRISPVAGARHIYSSIPAFTADGGMVNLGYAAPNRYMLRTSDWTPLQGDQGSTSSLSPYRSDPLRAWCHNGTTGIKKLSISSTGVVTTAKTLDFVALSGTYSQVWPGGGQGVQDMNDEFLAYWWKKADGTWGLGIYSLITEAVFAERQFGTGLAGTLLSVVDNCGVSLTGAWCWATFTPDGTGFTQGMWTYPIDLSTGTRRQILVNQEHCDWVLNGAGQDRFAYWGGAIKTFDPATGVTTTIISNVGENCHVSGQAFLDPGWLFFANYGDPDDYSNPGYGEIVACDIDNPGSVRRYGHQHRTTPISDYSEEAHVSPSPDGRFAVFANRWQGSAGVHCWVTGVSL